MLNAFADPARASRNPDVKADVARERGFTMIELLVVCIVTAVISAVSVPVYLKHRANAKEDSVAADARQAGVALSAQATGSGMVPSSVDAQGAGIWNFKPSSPNTVAEYKAQDTRFRICIVNTTASPRAWAYYESVTNKAVSGTGTEPTGACDGNTAGPALPAETVRGPSTPIPTPPVATEVALAVGEKCHTFSTAPGATGYKSLSWNAVSGATAYRVKEYRNGTLVNNTLVTGTTHQAANTSPDTWQYTVDARGEGFTGPCAAPTYTPPAVDGYRCITFNETNGSTASTKDLSWTAVSGANGYRIKTYRDGVVQGSTIVTGTTTTVNSPSGNIWQWAVEARGSGFTDSTCPTPVVPAASCPTSITFNGPAWQPTSVSWSTGNNTTSASAYLVNSDGTESVLSGSGTATLPAHVRDGRFTGVRVEPRNASGANTGCTAAAISTYVLPCPSISMAANGAGADVYWTIVNGAETNILQKRVPPTTGTAGSLPSTVATYNVPTNTGPGSQTKYEYRVLPRSTRYTGPMSCPYIMYGGGGGGGAM